MVSRDEIVMIITNKIVHKIFYIGLLSALGLFLAFPIIWIWDSWSLAWKVGLTSFIVWMVYNLVYYIIEKAVRGQVDLELLKEPKDRIFKYSKNKNFSLKVTELLQNFNSGVGDIPKSRFQNKMENMMREANAKNKK